MTKNWTSPHQNISPLVLPNFHGKSTEDPDEFLFEFDILCRSYDYISSEYKLKLFPSTLKGNALRWFMSLGGKTVTTWDQMKQVFLAKYQDYCKTTNKREELFKMMHKDDEILEDFVERLLYNVKSFGHTDIERN